MYVNPKNEIANHNPGLSLLLNEDTINLELHPKSVKDAKYEIKSCLSFLKIGQEQIDAEDSKYVTSIRRLAFVDLYNVANNIGGSGNYLTGLKIEFGVNNDQLCFVFIPVRLDDGQRIVRNAEYYSYDKIESSKKFKYNVQTEKFDEITTSERDTLTNNYKQTIQILHSKITGDSYADFMPDIDVESMIFSFQEIFAIMYDNRGIANELTKDIFTGLEDEPVNIHNCVRRDLVHSICLTKHGLLLSPNLFAIVDFKNIYGNLAHLCPPHCIKIVYSLE